jgi:hypothetical protein
MNRPGFRVQGQRALGVWKNLSVAGQNKTQLIVVGWVSQSLADFSAVAEKLLDLQENMR